MLYWLAYLLLFASIELSSRLTYHSSLFFDLHFLADIFFPFFAGFLSFYSFYLYLVPKILKKQNLKLFIGWGVIVCVFVALLTLSLFYLVTLFVSNIPLHFSASLFINSLLTYLILGSYFTFIALLNGILATLFKGCLIWYAEIHLKEALAKRNLQTELALLKAQLNPHFLFNTLHNIDILIQQDAARASLYLNKLSDILRFILYHTPSEHIPLSKELAYIDQYIELQKIRTANEQFVNFQVEGNEHQHSIPPMIFIPFIENAFKHTRNKKLKEAIIIRFALREQEISFTCRNQIGKGLSERHPERGLGLTLIKKRLELLYKNAYELTIQQNNAIFEVNLLLKMHDH